MARMVGRVRMFRPDVSHSHVTSWLNDRLRQCLDSRTYWADLLVHGIISVPDAYSTGTIAATTGSTTVTGTSTLWPVDDRVDTTVAEAVDEIGYVEVTPASMDNITADTLLYVDADMAPETVAVVMVTPSTFTAKFTMAHAAGFSVTSSSLAGRQLKVGNSHPIFTIRSVQTASSMTLDMPWGGPAISGSSPLAPVRLTNGPSARTAV